MMNPDKKGLKHDETIKSMSKGTRGRGQIYTNILAFTNDQDQSRRSHCLGQYLVENMPLAYPHAGFSWQTAPKGIEKVSK